MNVTRMRNLLRKRNSLAVPLVAGHFALHYAKQNKARTALMLTGAAIGLSVIAHCARLSQESNVSYHSPFISVTPGKSEPAAFDVTDLGTLGGKFSVASTVNNRGQVAGASHTATDEVHGYVWNGGKMTDTGTLGGDFSVAVGMNNSGETVGLSTRSASDEYIHAFVWRNGKMTRIQPGNAVASVANGINDSGTIVGAGVDKDDRIYGFLRKEGKTTIFFLLHSNFTVAQAINANGMIACYAITSGKIKSFTLQGEKHQGLPGLNDEDCFAEAINERGDVAGASYFNESDTLHAVVWRNGKPIDLGALPGLPDTVAASINRNGVVVGTALPPEESDHAGQDATAIASQQQERLYRRLNFVRPLDVEWSSVGNIMPRFGSNPTFLNRTTLKMRQNALKEAAEKNEIPHAFVWRDGKMTDLNKLLPSGSGWVLAVATGINDNRQITGFGLHDGKVRAFLLSPKK